MVASPRNHPSGPSKNCETVKFRRKVQTSGNDAARQAWLELGPPPDEHP
jgi:hypothetical protein